jgi:hypothetical protein
LFGGLAVAFELFFRELLFFELFVFQFLEEAGGGAFGLVLVFVGGVFGVEVEGYLAAEFVGNGVADLAGAVGMGGDRDKVPGVGTGYLEAVEESGRLAGVDAVVGHGVDEDGEGELDGVAVFERGEVELGEGGAAVGVEDAGVVLGEEGLAGHAVEVVLGDGVEDGGRVVGGPGRVVMREADVVVAEDFARETGRAATGSADPDVATDVGWHGRSPEVKWLVVSD